MQRKITVYTCPRCGDQRVTTRRDFGPLPDYLPCGQCDTFAVSEGSGSDQTRIPQWEWYRPRNGQLGRLEPNAREYVRTGGLLLRKIAKATNEPPPPNRYQRRRQRAEQRKAKP